MDMETSRIILAVDDLELGQCLDLVSNVGNQVYAIKIHNLFDQYRPSVVQRLRDAGARRVWVDAKLKDIPSTVNLRAKAIAKSGADILTVHASGEIEVMMAAVEAGPAEIKQSQFSPHLMKNRRASCMDSPLRQQYSTSHVSQNSQASTVSYVHPWK